MFSRILILCFPFLLLAASCTKTTVILVPDPHGKVGKVTVSPKIGSSHLLDEAQQSIGTYSLNIVPGEKEIVDMDTLPENLKETLRNEPEFPTQYSCYFDTDSAQLNDKCVGQLKLAIDKIKEKQSCDLVLSGHSDSVGEADYNIRLSFQRAKKLEKVLVDSGIHPECMRIVSYGESDLIVKTGDNVAEKLNRRAVVEIR